MPTSSLAKLTRNRAFYNIHLPSTSNTAFTARTLNSFRFAGFISPSSFLSTYYNRVDGHDPIDVDMIISKSAYSPHVQSADRLATCDDRGNVCVWDTRGLRANDEDAERQCVVYQHNTANNKHGCFDVSWMSHNETITIGGDEKARIQNIETQQCVELYHNHTAAAVCCALSPDDHNVFATGSYDGMMYVYDRRQLARSSNGYPKPFHTISPSHTSRSLSEVNAAKRAKLRSTVTTMTYVNRNTLLSSTSPGGSCVNEWDVRQLTRAVVKYDIAGTDAVAAVVMAHDRQHFYAQCKSGALYRCRRFSGTSEHIETCGPLKHDEHTRSNYAFRSMAMHPHNDWLLVQDECSEMVVVDLRRSADQRSGKSYMVPFVCSDPIALQNHPPNVMNECFGASWSAEGDAYAVSSGGGTSVFMQRYSSAQDDE